VLASNATKTMVCIGCVKALRETVWRRCVICLFIYPGFAGAPLLCSWRRRAGRKEAPSMLVFGGIRGMIGGEYNNNKR